MVHNLVIKNSFLFSTNECSFFSKSSISSRVPAKTSFSNKFSEFVICIWNSIGRHSQIVLRGLTFLDFELYFSPQVSIVFFPLHFSQNILTWKKACPTSLIAICRWKRNADCQKSSIFACSWILFANQTWNTHKRLSWVLSASFQSKIITLNHLAKSRLWDELLHSTLTEQNWPESGKCWIFFLQ